jgi:VCBS repeat-containing protein
MYEDSTGALVTTASVTVIEATPPPTAVDDAYTTAEDTPVTGNVLANDPDAFVSVSSGTIPTAHGTVTVASDGVFSYTPASNYNGTDTFTYTASRGDGSTDQASVTITVTAVNDRPVANPDSYTTAEDTPLSVPASGVLTNDTDVEGNPVVVVLLGDVSNGSLTLNEDGSFVYTPRANFSGTDSFRYGARESQSQGLSSTSTTVTITVTSVLDAPIAVADAYTVAEDGTLVVGQATGLLANDVDVENRGLLVGNPTLPAHGTLSLDSYGAFTYQPDAGFSGTDTFTYRDRYNTGVDFTPYSPYVTVTITVTAVNDAPVLTNLPADVGPIEATGPDGAVVPFTPPTATDPDGGTPTVTCAVGNTTVTSPALFPVGTTTVTCTATPPRRCSMWRRCPAPERRTS